MKSITLFSWGYYGWGNSTKQLIKAVDAVESSRGFGPPIFVDIRIRRSVRAPGFRETEFEKLLDPDRHRWMRDLGNESIITHAKRMKIRNPKAASELLHLAVDASKRKQRVVFFCSCQFPMYGRKRGCHRTLIAELLLKSARTESVAVEVVEWPGGKPETKEIDVTSQVFESVRKGRMTIPVRKAAELSDIAGMAWATIVTLHSAGQSLERLTGPAVYRQGKWCLPVMDWNRGSGFLLKDAENESAAARQYYGYEPRRSL